MTRVIVAPTSVAMFPEGGGHLWVFLQWIRGLQRNGCDVYWLECIEPRKDRTPERPLVDAFLRTVDRLGMADRVLVYQAGDAGVEFLNVDTPTGWAAIDNADLLLNFKYDTSQHILDRVSRSALVDIDPGLLQFWVSNDQLQVNRHDLYFTTSEHIGTDLVPSCGLDWHLTRPVVDTLSWTVDREKPRDMMTTVTNWYGDEWLTNSSGFLLDNNKRTGFLPFVDLPQLTPQSLELAVCFGAKVDDEADRAQLIRHGWHVRHSFDVSGDPFSYRDYIRRSRGEFSCAKPSCLLFQNAWISDRTLCYLSSGRPAVVQHTGPSERLPDSEGLLRFTDLESAVEALADMNRDYAHHSEAARNLAVSQFDAAAVSGELLDVALVSQIR